MLALRPNINQGGTARAYGFYPDIPSTPAQSISGVLVVLCVADFFGSRVVAMDALAFRGAILRGVYSPLGGDGHSLSFRCVPKASASFAHLHSLFVFRGADDFRGCFAGGVCGVLVCHWSNFARVITRNAYNNRVAAEL